MGQEYEDDRSSFSNWQELLRSEEGARLADWGSNLRLPPVVNSKKFSLPFNPRTYTHDSAENPSASLDGWGVVPPSAPMSSPDSTGFAGPSNYAQLEDSSFRTWVLGSRNHAAMFPQLLSEQYSHWEPSKTNASAQMSGFFLSPIGEYSPTDNGLHGTGAWL